MALKNKVTKKLKEEIADLKENNKILLLKIMHF